jgi:hypothetical protein
MSAKAWILFYYNSLPDMPDSCALFSRQVMHRDFVRCNPSNTGHHEYPKFETLSYDEGCHGPQIRKIVERQPEERYVVFYTRHTRLDGGRMNKLVGYFKVGAKAKGTKRKGFSASEAVLLPKDKCVPISYHGRGVPVSEGNSSAKRKVDAFLEKCFKNKPLNISRLYRTETATIMKDLKSARGRRKILNTCTSCDRAQDCFWGRTRNKEEVLDQLYAKVSVC